MANIVVPIRPIPDKFKLSEDEKNGATWYCLSGKKEYAFARFVRPDLILSDTALKAATRQFFSREDVAEYMTAYIKTLKSMGQQTPESVGQITDENRDKRKLSALKKLVDYVIKEADQIDSLEDPSTLLKIADKVGFFDELGDKVEAPRRYLPQTCGACAYKQFIDEQVTLGNIAAEGEQ